MTTYIVPVVTILLSWMFLGQTPAWLSFAGGAACLAGVAVTRRKGRLAWRPRRVPAVAQPAGTGSTLSKQPSNLDSWSDC
jgi:EamA-like transporter family